MLWRRYDMLLIMFIKHWYLIKLKINDQQGLTNLRRHSISPLYFLYALIIIFFVFSQTLANYISENLKTNILF